MAMRNHPGGAGGLYFGAERRGEFALLQFASPLDSSAGTECNGHTFGSGAQTGT